MAPQKRTATEAEAVLDGIKALLVDIEGTTTPISFIKETLFPYITNNLESFLEKHFDEVNCQADIQLLRQLAKKDKEANVDGVMEIPDTDADKDTIMKAVIANVKWQMSQDRKCQELKQLQGHIWKEAYKQGTIKGVLFSDVVPTLRQMVDDGIKIYVYSSGSVITPASFYTNIFSLLNHFMIGIFCFAPSLRY
ncbi:mtnC [Acanthosepion pharaonis]|uniref:MtnC n=1 Tax=Acanthosepion pharaonis TaxID=158019 RepID=A0A812C653_ACAPH|nr:mtnC [Sepia pharaonis]